MDKQVLSTFQFEDYKVNSISFKRNEAFTYDNPIEVDFKFDSKVAVDNMNKTTVVTLDVTVCNPERFEKYPFTLFISLSGLFRYNGEEDIENQEYISKFKLYGITALFPFLRSMVADITRLTNNVPVILPLINVYNYLDTE